LHTNGANTHPVILIMNAMLANKRVIFLGHNMAANHVARMVLAACALSSGCGQVLRGIASTAFPYANLASLDVLEGLPGFVAGVINPRFEELPHTWDVLCNIDTGKVTVSKDVRSTPAPVAKEKSSDSSLGSSIYKVGEEVNGTPAAKMTAVSKPDSIDNLLMDDVSGIVIPTTSKPIALWLGDLRTRIKKTEADEGDRHEHSYALWRSPRSTPVHGIPRAIRYPRCLSGIYAYR
jgi:hypothetical protein